MPDDFDLNKWKEERNTALRSMDLVLLRQYCRKYDVRNRVGKPLADEDGEMVLASMHMARCELIDSVIPRGQKLLSQEWLNAHHMRSPQQMRCEKI